MHSVHRYQPSRANHLLGYQYIPTILSTFITFIMVYAHHNKCKLTQARSSVY